MVEELPESNEESLDNQNIIEPDQIVFSIQVASSKNKIPTDPSSFKGYKGVRILSDGRWFKYLIGSGVSYHTALEKCNEIKADYPDAFVVASKNDKLVPLKDALQEINK
jgi:N-acetylmuramoyl-L-alanine amidase